MYNILCEVREVQGRDQNSTTTGQLVTTFKGKVFVKSANGSIVGMGMSDVANVLSVNYKYNGVKIIPHKHSVVINGEGYIVSQVIELSRNIHGKLVKGKSIIKVVLDA